MSMVPTSTELEPDVHRIMYRLKPRRVSRRYPQSFAFADTLHHFWNQKSLAHPPPLPILNLIAKHLVSLNLHATCAALTVTAKAVREETTPVLWRKVVFQWNNSPNGKKKSALKWRTVFESTSAKYIQYVALVPLLRNGG
jgi:hypothetical protein